MGLDGMHDTTAHYWKANGTNETSYRRMLCVFAFRTVLKAAERCVGQGQV